MTYNIGDIVYVTLIKCWGIVAGYSDDSERPYVVQLLIFAKDEDLARTPPPIPVKASEPVTERVI